MLFFTIESFKLIFEAETDQKPKSIENIFHIFHYYQEK